MRRLTALAFAAILAFPTIFAGPAGARVDGTPAAPVYGTEEAEGDIWFVELASAPIGRGGSASQLAEERERVADALRAAGIAHTVRYDFRTLWNGLSIEVARRDVPRIARIKDVAAVYPVLSEPMPSIDPIDPELVTSLAMIGADRATSEMGATGAGIRVGIIDSGIDYRHPDLGGCFGPGCKVAFGWDFVGDAFTGGSAPLNPGPDPMDCNSHGTFVAGIVGAKPASATGVRGVAPDVTLGAYKVFGCTGGSQMDVIIAAMERALADGMHVVNLSLSRRFSWPQFPTGVAADTLVDNGVVVVGSFANTGRWGAFSGGVPGIAEKAIAVAAFDNTHSNTRSFTVNAPGDGRRVPYMTLRAAELPPTAGTSAPIVHVGRGCEDDAYLAPAGGKVALMERGGCGFNVKYQRAVQEGAVGVLIYNNAEGLFRGTGAVAVPGVFGATLSRADGLYLAGHADVTAAWSDVAMSIPNPTGGLISPFSAYGLTPDLAVKPDVGGPSNLIHTTMPLAMGGYGYGSGTSASAPHVAGGAALILQGRPGTRAGDVRDLMVSTADPRPWWRAPDDGILEAVHRQGTGMMDIPAAIAAPARISPAKIALGASHGAPTRTVTVTVRNTSTATLTYNIGHRGAVATRGTMSIAYTQDRAAVELSRTTLTLAAGASATFQATITAPATPEPTIYGGFLVLTPDGGEGITLRVPYAGYAGDYHAIKHLGDGGAGLPRLATGGTAELRVNELSVRHNDPDRPFVHVHIAHPARWLRLEVFDAVTGARVGIGRHIDHTSRDRTPTEFHSFSWPLTADGQRVPPGRYYLEVVALKALGDPANPAHTERQRVPGIIEVTE